MTEKISINEVKLKGTIVSDAFYNYTDNEVEYYKFYVAVERPSGIKDILPVVVSKCIIDHDNLELVGGNKVNILGEYCSYATGEKFLLYIYAKSIFMHEEGQNPNNVNYIHLKGNICKISPLKILSKGRRVINMLLAVEQENSRMSYIPCAIWGISDQVVEELKIGRKVTVIGRIQSREYSELHSKVFRQRKVAYEVSVKEFEL